MVVQSDLLSAANTYIPHYVILCPSCELGGLSFNIELEASLRPLLQHKLYIHTPYILTTAKRLLNMHFLPMMVATCNSSEFMPC